ncbi:MAG: SprT-like domain-containing protein [Polyangiaceae bacterium]|nr:SprT-like domain-containing protein [Polyangiaceae bacterium]
MEPGPKLSLELEQAALRAVRTAYGQFNDTYFGGKLRSPVLRWSDAAGNFGRYTSVGRSIELSRSLMSDHGWGVLLEVLKHEMAHQFVFEVLGLEEPPHGPTFQRICRERGIDAHATGLPRPHSQGPESIRILERVSKLLALAQSSNQHEAESATAAAQRLMLKYNIELGGEAASSNYVHRHLGKASGRINEAMRTLANILTDHFFVQGLWVPVWRPLEGKRGSVFEICGTRENVEMAEYAHAFLSHSAEQLWRTHKRDAGLRGNADRLTYVAGVMAGFLEKLNAQKARHKEEGLVWLGDAELRGFFKRRHPRVRFTYYGGGSANESFASGRDAGRSLVLHRGVQSGPSGGAKLLRGRGD